MRKSSLPAICLQPQTCSTAVLTLVANTPQTLLVDAGIYMVHAAVAADEGAILVRWDKLEGTAGTFPTLDDTLATGVGVATIPHREAVLIEVPENASYLGFQSTTAIIAHISRISGGV